MRSAAPTGAAMVTMASGERVRNAIVPSTVYTAQQHAPSSMSRSPTSRRLDTSSPACPARITSAAPTEASAKPASFVAVRRSPMNEAARAVRTGMVVGTISAPSDAGAIVRPTKTNALYAK